MILQHFIGLDMYFFKGKVVLDFGLNNFDLTLPADASTQVSAFLSFQMFTK